MHSLLAGVGLETYASCTLLEMALAFLLGVLVGLLTRLSNLIEPLGLLLSVLILPGACFFLALAHSEQIPASTLQAVAAILCAFITRLFFEYITPVCYLAVVLAGIIWLLPGTSRLECASCASC